MESSKVNQLQLWQQNLQNLLLQKQQLQQQLLELDSALAELKTTSKAYKIVGKIMIVSSREELTKELQGKKEVIEIRFKNFAQQEESLQKKMEELQKEALAELKKKK